MKNHIFRGNNVVFLHIFRRGLKKVSFIEASFLGKVSSIKEISYDFSSFIKENVVTLHPD